MKKLFTLIALLTCFLGAKAVEIVDGEVDFSKYSDISEWNFPHSWGGSQSARDRLSIVDGCLHFESTEATDPSWDCQFFPIGTKSAPEVDVTYTLHFKIKGDHNENVSMLGFGQTPYGQFPITTEWVEGTVDYVCTNADGNILMQCGAYIGTWDIAYLKITHEGKEEKPIEWVDLLTNGDAETPWGDLADIKYDDPDNVTKVCAWNKEKGVNLSEEPNEDGNFPWNPFPATIEEEPGNPSNHVFVLHGKPADTEGDASAWDNQFWIMSTKELKVGSEYKFHFRYKASEAANTNTQMHSIRPSDYLHYQVLGDVSFTTEWKEYDQVVTIPTPQNDRPIYSIAFNLNSQNKNAIDFYFDDISISEVKVEHGFFVAASNTETGIEYDFDEAVELVEDADLSAMVATVGTVGKKDTWVNEVMISTVRGNNKAFRASTLKPTEVVENDPDKWIPYEEASSAKIKLPAAGVWQIAIDTNENLMNFVKLEGEADVEKIEINPNTTEIVVHGAEKTANSWDNQFFIVSNRELAAGEDTWLEFDYWITSDAVEEARVTTQYQGEPGDWAANSATEDLTFTTEKKSFKGRVTITNSKTQQGKAIKSLAFNMAEITEPADYYITNVVWRLFDGTETLINMEGTKNFWMSEGAGPLHEFGKEPPTGKRGDLTGDDKVNGTDIQTLINAIVEEEEDPKFDINGDGKINGTDIQELINIILEEE